MEGFEAVEQCSDEAYLGICHNIILGEKILKAVCRQMMIMAKAVPHLYSYVTVTVSKNHVSLNNADQSTSL